MSHSLVRPTKIEWVLPNPKLYWADNWTGGIVSKSVKKIAKNLDTILDANKLTPELSQLDEAKYRDWHDFYQARMVEQRHRVIATPDWFADISQQKKYSQLMLVNYKVQQSSIAGSIWGVQNSKIVHIFKASHRLATGNQQNSSLGTVMELFFLRYALQHSFDQVSAGTSQNAFGYLNTLGYLASKLKLGYFPRASALAEQSAIFPALADTPMLWFLNQDPIGAAVYPSKESLNSELLIYLDRIGVSTQLMTNGIVSIVHGY